MRQQAKYYPLFGDQVTLLELAMRAGVCLTAMRKRLKAGLTPEQAVNRGRDESTHNVQSEAWAKPISEHPEARKAIARAAAVGGYTLDEVATEMGLTRQRVGKIEERAIRKLRHTFPHVAEHLEGIREREERMLGGSRPARRAG